MPAEQPNAFENKTIIKDSKVEVQEEKRPNLEALEKKRDEYLLRAIKELENKDPKNFKQGNIDNLIVDVTGILMKEHNIHPSINVEDEQLEFYDTYTEEHIKELLEKYFSERSK